MTFDKVSRSTRRGFLASSVGFALMAAAGPAYAAFTPQQTDALGKINSYFNAIRTMQGRFIQFGPNGEQSDGVFFISRPGKIRFHYSPPVKMDVICDGNQVAVRDSKVMTQDLYPLAKTPLRYLLADRIDLTSADIVRQLIEEPDLISLVLKQDSAFGDGSLKLIFDNKTFELRQWVVTDAQGLDTSVAVYDVEIGRPADPKNFKIDYYLPNSK
ncbi:outer-membrane lipoprotein carrier protein LolA [Kaistia dalseonensis]|uniref:Outer membrane lipoprotein-sorting protein n=1 Tax=Kaistia dalseonensis TaxID=410840 RepID=A0ABU0H4S1_9HYPH|nr:outer-membrane lipoprotein carrier protein LolA [Kaistia dalseonensis]MCX5494720.1 outer-membrane lipoprotein carrier protein LolA [Kaistia dalseonensis]MDQ0437301.1 outer membrane lipoprotein-sorting protein [Kaistia dalseonensis]